MQHDTATPSSNTSERAEQLRNQLNKLRSEVALHEQKLRERVRHLPSAPFCCG